MEMEDLNINSIVERLMGAAEFDKIKATYRRVQIEEVLAPELLNIKGSYIHIEKAIRNLVINGAQETVHKEGGQVTISTANCTVEDAVAGEIGLPCGEYVMLSVADNGAGIPEEYQEKIFDPFFTTKDVGQGTGLGLSIVHGVVKNHKGTIKIDSQEGEGAAFTLTFPVISSVNPDPDGG